MDDLPAVTTELPPLPLPSEPSPTSGEAVLVTPEAPNVGLRRFGDGATSIQLPALVERAGVDTARRFVEFFTAEIRNRNTRRVYAAAVGDFLAWCEGRSLGPLEKLEPVHVAGYVEDLGARHEPATVKVHLAAVRMLFDYLVRGGLLRFNPAAAVRGPRLVVRSGKTPALAEEEARELIDSIGQIELVDLRDRALIGIMLFAFARVSAVVGLRVRDYEARQRRAWVALREKGGQWRRVPLHTKAAEMLDAWLAASGLTGIPDVPIFQGFVGRTGALRGEPLTARGALVAVKRRAEAAGLPDSICNHSFRASGITAFLRAKGTLEVAAAIAGHASTRTTQLYDRRRELVEPDDIERIRI